MHAYLGLYTINPLREFLIRKKVHSFNQFMRLRSRSRKLLRARFSLHLLTHRKLLLSGSSWKLKRGRSATPFSKFFVCCFWASKRNERRHLLCFVVHFHFGGIFLPLRAFVATFCTTPENVSENYRYTFYRLGVL